jgi:hypothetical protein
MSVKQLLRRVKACFRRKGKSSRIDHKCDPAPIHDEGKESSPPVAPVRPSRARGLQGEKTTSFVPPMEVPEVSSAAVLDELPACPPQKLEAKGAEDWAEFYLSSLRKLVSPYRITSTEKSSLPKGKLRFTAAEYQAEIGEPFQSKPVVSFHSLTF